MDNKPKTWLVMLALIIAEMTSTFEASMAFSALPTFYRTFGDPVGTSWVITIFFLVSAATAALCARLGDMYGRRRLMIIVLAIASLGSLISALSSGLPGLITGRALQGVTGAIFPLCVGLMRENLPSNKVPFYIGVMGGVVTVSAGLAFMLAGVILDHFHWQALFYCSLGLALTGIVLMRLLISASPRAAANRQLDVLGGVLFVPAITAILFAVTKSQSYGWTHPLILGLLIGGVIVGTFWVRHEYRHPEPLIDVRLFAHRPVLLANLAFGMAALGAMNIPQVLMVLLQQPLSTGVGFGLSATVAGLAKQPQTFIGMLASPVGGRIASRYGARAAMVCSTVALVIGWGLMYVFLDSLAIIVVATIIIGIVMTKLYGAVPNQIVEVTPPGRTSEATALAQVSRGICAAVGTQVIAVLMSSSTIVNPAKGLHSFPDASAYRLTVAYIVATCVLAFVCALLLPRRAPAVVELPAPARA